MTNEEAEKIASDLVMSYPPFHYEKVLEIIKSTHTRGVKDGMERAIKCIELSSDNFYADLEGDAAESMNKNDCDKIREEMRKL